MQDQQNPLPPITSPEPATEPERSSPAALARELGERYAKLSALYVAGARLSATLEWEPLLEQTLQTVMHLVSGDSASLALFDDRCGDMYIAAASHLSAAVIADIRIKRGEGVVGWVAQHREALLINGPIDVERFPKSLPKPKEFGAVICVPLIPPSLTGQSQSVLGVLSIHRRVHGAPFDQEELELVTGLTTQVAAALQNARLYRQLQRRHSQLETLIEISQGLAVNLDVDSVLDLIISKAMHLLGCEAGSLLLVDPSSDELVFKVAHGMAGPKLVDRRLSPGTGIAGQVARTGQPLIVNDVKIDPRHDPSIDEATALTTRAVLCVPLVSKERVIGVIEVVNKIDGSAFGDEDRDSLVGFALQSTIALENARLYSDLRDAFTDTVRVIANAVEARDPYTAGHSERVTRIAIETAREMGWTHERIEMLEIGAMLHDIGKIGVSDAVLRKPAGLTAEEYTEMKHHPIFGARMLESVTLLESVLPYVLYHQERYDGQGYPFGLAGNEIPAEGRLLAVVDSFDAMTSERPYHRAMTVAEAVQEVIQHRGSQFDPEVVDAIVRIAAKGKLDFLKPPVMGSIRP